MRKYRQRIHYTETDKALMWDRWRIGDSFSERPCNSTNSRQGILFKIIKNSFTVLRSYYQHSSHLFEASKS
jgi:hypothetical protein